MTDPTDDDPDEVFDEALDPHLERALSAMLSSPSVWIDPPPGGEESVVRAIDRAVDRALDGEVRSERLGPVPTRRTARRLTAAATVVLIAGIATVAAVASTRDSTSPGVAVALASADPDGTMTATALVERTAGGVKIVLDPSELPPADPGTYYHAWLTNDRDRVSAGTFHLRGGGGTIELWCGIDDPSYRTLAVTLERVVGEPADEHATDHEGDSGGRQPVVLVGRIDD